MLSRPILFVFANTGTYRLQRSMIERFRAHGRPLALHYANGRDPTAALAEADAKKLGLDLSVFEEAPAAPSEFVPPAERRTSSLRRLVARAIARRRAPAFYAAHRASISKAAALLKRIAPSAVVVSEDGVSGPLAILSAARLMGIPVVDVPYGNAGRQDFEIDLDRKAADGSLQRVEGPARQLLGLLAPQWIKTGRHAGAVMFPFDYIVAAEAVGMTLRDAWIVHGGHSDRLCAENVVAQRQYAEEGVLASKVVLTGSPYCDEMVAGLDADPAARAALLAPRFIESGCPRILVSWPPSYHETFPGRSEFATYEAMTAAVLGQLARCGCRTTVSVHPAANQAARDIAQGLGLRVTDEHVIGLMARHDIFVTYFSSTIRWALASGKVVLNYDAYGLGLTAYESAPGFLNATTFADLCGWLERLTGSEEAFAGIAARQIAVAPDWGILDGQCTQRILGEIDGLIASQAHDGRKSRQ